MTNPLYEPIAAALQEAPFDIRSGLGQDLRDALVDGLREAGERGDDPRAAMSDFAVLTGVLVVSLNMVAHNGALCVNCVGGSLLAITEAIIRQKEAQEDYVGAHEEKH